MRDGLKNRVNGNQYYLQNNTLSHILQKEGIKQITFNKRVVPSANSCKTKNCNSIDSINDGGLAFDLEARNHYYAPFRQPIKGWRKSLVCEDSNKNCLTTTEIYKDSYSTSLCATISCLDAPSTYTSLPTSNKKNASQTRATTGISMRAGRPLIRSGMQPNSSGQQNSGLPVPLNASGQGNPKKYSYSYRELLNNRRKVTYEKKLATEKPIAGSIVTTGFGGDCTTNASCQTTIHRLNNSKFQVQGAVDSSDRITRLKLNTIKSGRRCPAPTNEPCKGLYRTGHAQTATDSKLWPSPTNNYDKVKYKSKFNSGHLEVNYPQVSALARVRGNVGSSRTNLPNKSICCDNPDQSINGY